MIARHENFPLARNKREPFYEIVILISHKIVFYCISSTNHYINILRHPQLSMSAMGVGEGEDIFLFQSEHLSLSGLQSGCMKKMYGFISSIVMPSCDSSSFHTFIHSSLEWISSFFRLNPLTNPI